MHIRETPNIEPFRVATQQKCCSAHDAIFPEKDSKMKRLALVPLLALALAAAPAFAKSSQFDVFSDGAKAGKFDVFTDGAKKGKYDVYTNGARNGKFDVFTDGAAI